MKLNMKHGKKKLKKIFCQFLVLNQVVRLTAALELMK